MKSSKPHFLAPFAFFFIITIAASCKKAKKIEGCFPEAETIRQVTDKKAVIQLNATIHGVYIFEEGSIDTKLIPCNLPMDFYQNNLQVIISGDVKAAPGDVSGPCCTDYFIITKITR